MRDLPHARLAVVELPGGASRIYAGANAVKSVFVDGTEVVA